MSIKTLRFLIREELKKNLILSERPWAAEFHFKMKGGTAEDSEGIGPDGLKFIFNCGEQELKVVLDSYWNPQSGDSSGNELKIYVNDVLKARSYVPVRFDDGKFQTLIVSNSPVENKISFSHGYVDDVPIYYLCVSNPFEKSKPIKMKHSSLMSKGQKSTYCELVNVTNV